jgi:AcrR family transcriptional regulator
MPDDSPAPRPRKKRNPRLTRSAILQAALEEFSEVGHSGARVDRIAERAGVSKPMIYDHFGDKDGIYAAALREAYVQIRQGEAALNPDITDPEAAVRALVHFTMDHFRRNPWFIRMLNTENLLGGDTIRALDDAADIQSVLVDTLGQILEQGVQQGLFRDDMTPVDFYIFIASLCYFPVSNMHTLRAVFRAPIDTDWLDRHAAQSADMLLAFLRLDPKTPARRQH